MLSKGKANLDRPLYEPYFLVERMATTYNCFIKLMDAFLSWGLQLVI